MSRISKITLAQSKVSDYFNAVSRQVFSQTVLHDLIEKKRREWDLPETPTPAKIIQKWIDNGFIKSQLFSFSDESEILMYIHGEPTIYEIAVNLRPKSYISHYPAMFLHNLTTQVPKTIYTTLELSPKQYKPSSLTQTAIDKAFSNPQRRSQLSTVYEEYAILLLNSKYSNRNGVLVSARYNNSFSLTNLERTLIDITVRPNYAGGSYSVFQAYRRAVEDGQLSTNKFMSILKALDFIYPYHQAIGFYLEKAGYQGKLLQIIAEIPRIYNFYLDYDISNKQLDGKWKVWYPKEMQ
jgi:hypothetical protein